MVVVTESRPRRNDAPRLFALPSAALKFASNRGICERAGERVRASSRCVVAKNHNRSLTTVPPSVAP